MLIIQYWGDEAEIKEDGGVISAAFGAFKNKRAYKLYMSKHGWAYTLGCYATKEQKKEKIFKRDIK